MSGLQFLPKEYSTFKIYENADSVTGEARESSNSE